MFRIFAWLLLAQAPAPEAGVVYGTVREASSLEPIPYASVQIAALGRGASADPRGYFVLAGVPGGTWEIEILAPGYVPRADTVAVTPGDRIEVEIFLAPQPYGISPLKVRSHPERAPPGPTGAPGIRLTGGDINTRPALAEADVFRALQASPAVAAASDYSAALYVRGGSPDQNLILLDGAPLFNPFHLGGVFAAIDPDAVASVDLQPGGFSASAGDRLSSIVDIRTREGGRDEVRGNGALGLLSARVGVDGPLPGGRGSFLVSARRTYLDALTGAAARLGLLSDPLPYGFVDAHVKLSQDVGEHGRATIAGYVDQEYMDDPSLFSVGHGGRLDWGTRLVSARYRHVLLPRALLDVYGALSSFDASGTAWSDLRTGARETVLDGRGRMRDIRLGADVTVYAGTHRFSVGAASDAYLFSYDITHEEPDLAGFLPLLTREDRFTTQAVYLEDEWSPGRGVRMRMGVRAVHEKSSGWEILPRGGVSADVGRGFAIRAAGGRSVQYVRSLRNEESVLASLFAYDILVAVPTGTPPPSAADGLVGVTWAGKATRVQADLYRKWFSELLIPQPPGNPVTAPLLATDSVAAGSGTATGLEVLVQRDIGRVAVTLGYVLATATRTLAGESFTPRFHRTHALDIAAALKVGRASLLTARLATATGQRYTPVVGVHFPFLTYPRGEITVTTPVKRLLLGPHNSATLPGYVRLDIAARTTIEREWRGTTVRLTPFIQVLNLLGNRNVLWAEPEIWSSDPTLAYAPQLPVLPTLGIEWRF